MAGRKRTILFDVIVDDADARRALGRLDKNVGKTATAFGKAATGIKVAVGAVAGRAVLNFAQQSIDAASDLEESINKVGAIFGDNADEIKDWADGSAQSMGISAQAALEAAGSFGAFFDALGVGAADAARMSTDLVELAADMASFNNIDPTEMLTKLQSGLSGEVEPLRKFGVDLSAAAVNAKALQLGLAGTATELTQSDKVMARYAIILDQTASAQGDFERTSGGVANQQRILRAELENTSAEIGEKLLPAYLDLLRVTGDLAPTIAGAAKGAAGGVTAIVKSVQGLAGIFDESSAAASDLWLNLSILDENGFKTEDTVRNLAMVLGSMAEEGTLTEQAVKDLGMALGASNEDIVAAADLVQQKWIPGLENSTEASENLEDAVGDVRTEVTKSLEVHDSWAIVLGLGADEADRQKTALEELADEQRKATDPLFKLKDAQDKFNKALADYYDASTDGASSTDDMAKAQLDLYEAALDLQWAQDGANEVIGDAWPIFDELARSLGLTNDELREYLELARGAASTSPIPGSAIPGRSTSPGSGIVAYATGGVVPGPIGSPQLAVVHGGEEVLTPQQRGRGNGGSTLTIHNLNVRASWDFTDPTIKRTIVTSIEEALTEYGAELGI